MPSKERRKRSTTPKRKQPHLESKEGDSDVRKEDAAEEEQDEDVEFRHQHDDNNNNGSDKDYASSNSTQKHSIKERSIKKKPVENFKSHQENKSPQKHLKKLRIKRGKKMRQRLHEKNEEIEKAYLSSVPGNFTNHTSSKNGTQSAPLLGHQSKAGLSSPLSSLAPEDSILPIEVFEASPSPKEADHYSLYGYRADVLGEQLSLESCPGIQIIVDDLSESEHDPKLDPNTTTESEISLAEFNSLQSVDSRVEALRVEMQRLHTLYSQSHEVSQDAFARSLSKIMIALEKQRIGLRRIQSASQAAREKLQSDLEERTRCTERARQEQRRRIMQQRQQARRIEHYKKWSSPSHSVESRTTLGQSHPKSVKKPETIEEVKEETSKPKLKRIPKELVLSNPQASLLANLPRGVRSPIRQLHESKLLVPVRSERR